MALDRPRIPKRESEQSGMTGNNRESALRQGPGNDVSRQQKQRERFADQANRGGPLFMANRPDLRENPPEKQMPTVDRFGEAVGTLARTAGKAGENLWGFQTGLASRGFDAAKRFGSGIKEGFVSGEITSKGKGRRGDSQPEGLNPENRAVAMEGHSGGPRSISDARVTNTRRPDTLPRPVQNDDKRLSRFLETDSQPRSEGLNARNRQQVPGVAGVDYAGRYGDTDVFASETEVDGERVTNFSDRANAATLRGGDAAPVPPGRRAVTNADEYLTERVVEDEDGKQVVERRLDGPDMRTQNQLGRRRQEAMDRGDYEAVERSRMTSDERAQLDRQRKDERHRERAYEENPAATYAADAQDRTNRLASQQEGQRRQAESMNETISKAFETLQETILDGSEYLSEEDEAAKREQLEAVMPLLREVAQEDQYRGLDPVTLAHLALERARRVGEPQ